MVNQDSSFSETHRGSQNQMGGQMQTEEWEARREEWMMRGGRADVWGPPCLPTMSSSPLLPHLSVSLPPALLQFLLFSLSCFSLSFSAVISHPSLSSSPYVSFSPLSVTLLSSLLSVSTAVSLQLCSIALVLSITLLISYCICSCIQRFFQSILKIIMLNP